MLLPAALLERVLLRLTTCEGDEALEAQIDALLCPILLKCPTDSAAVHAKVTAVLKYITEVRPLFRSPLSAAGVGRRMARRECRHCHTSPRRQTQPSLLMLLMLRPGGRQGRAHAALTLGLAPGQ